MFLVLLDEYVIVDAARAERFTAARLGFPGCLTQTDGSVGTTAGTAARSSAGLRVRRFVLGGSVRARIASSVRSSPALPAAAKVCP